MKLARLQHERCGEHAATTYMWIPDTMPEDTLRFYVEKARESYLAAEQEYQTAAPVKNPGYAAARFENYPDKTVREVQEIFQEERAQWDAYQQKVRAARKTFSDHLVRVSEGLIKDFYDERPEIDVEVDWGHRHGTAIEFGDTPIYEQDFGAKPVEDDS